MITLSSITLADLVDNFPSLFNTNMSTIKTHIDDLENILISASKTLKLTNLTSVPNGGIEAATLTLTATTGNVFAVSPNGGTATATLTSAGALSIVSITATGTGSAKSSIADLDIVGILTVTGATTFNSKVLFTGANSQLAFKSRAVPVTNAMTGSGATNPLDISKDYIVYLDCNNSGSALANSSEIKLDTSLLVEGQIIKFHLLRQNVGSQKFFNGATGAEVFAYADPTTGFVSIAAGTKPEFTPSTSPNNQSYMWVQWTNIGGGNFRLVVLESKNVSNVS